MTRRDYFTQELLAALTAEPALHVLRNFVVSQAMEYATPYAAVDVTTEQFNFFQQEYNVVPSARKGTCQFSIYAGFKLDFQDVTDAGLLAAECNRVFALVENAIEIYSFNDTTINGKDLELTSVTIQTLVPAFLDTEMRGNALIEGAIEYVEYAP